MIAGHRKQTPQEMGGIKEARPRSQVSQQQLKGRVSDKKEKAFFMSSLKGVSMETTEKSRRGGDFYFFRKEGLARGGRDEP